MHSAVIIISSDGEMRQTAGPALLLLAGVSSPSKLLQT
jgi:hypothetical protein